MGFLAISQRALRKVSEADQAVIDEVMNDVYASVDAESWDESENAVDALLSVGIENVEPKDGEVERISNVGGGFSLVDLPAMPDSRIQ